MIEAIIIFAIAGALDGVRDAIADSKLDKIGGGRVYPKAFIFLPKLGNLGHSIYRWLMGIRHVIRIKIWKLCNMPLDGWHFCKTICYISFAIGTIILGNDWIMLIVCWAVIRPISQNIIQWSCLYGKWTFHKGLF